MLPIASHNSTQRKPLVTNRGRAKCSRTMADWQKVASEAKKAVKKVDQAIGQLDKEINAAFDAALADGKVTKKERARIDALNKQSNELVNTRTKILDAAIEALDRGTDLARMRRTMIGIRKRLENRQKELKKVEQAASAVGQALSTIAGILTILI